ncbi:hypothetical protein PF002_g16926 [Phytophthora fragariae]|uniref:Uncharacterized protein n=1 Tax=Phytophthora fragariae TaxID=53985 RepID=A0A6A3YDR3_9STRA|nr:hypothetical protein PF007_g15305 [Phytophthora fragariae]KAE9216994.1 hypothetical protein PF002_g16926 [Phytophthora fragariae]
MARTLTVSKVEATRTRQRQLLRQAAWTESAARFWHGQVVDMDGRLARLQLEDRVVLVEPARLTPVAPVVALLLLRVPLHASLTRDCLTDMQTTILAWILNGSDGAPASNDIPTILGGLVQPSDMPAGRSTRRWIDPRTGDPFTFQLQHAVDYAFVPHPGVIIRFYDFQFGMFGLSILHFAPFGVQQQMTWLNAGGANMQNFSAAETAPRPPVASSMGDLVDAARMLCRYGQEFFAQPVRDVLEELLDFAQQLDG